MFRNLFVSLTFVMFYSLISACGSSDPQTSSLASESPTTAEKEYSPGEVVEMIKKEGLTNDRFDDKSFAKALEVLEVTQVLGKELQSPQSDTDRKRDYLTSEIEIVQFYYARLLSQRSGSKKEVKEDDFFSERTMEMLSNTDEYWALSIFQGVVLGQVLQAHPAIQGRQ